MAKQRPQPKRKPRSSPAGSASEAPRASRGNQPPAPQSGTSRRSTYVEAVAVYEKGLQALQRHEYRQALELFQRVLSAYPEERELHDRVRLYLNICQRHASPPAATPMTLQERLYASTLALNGGRYDEAISHLRLVRDEDPDNDHALYMLAVAHAQRGEHAEAVVHLERAIALNPENRALARRDSDLEALHRDEAFQQAIEGSPAKGPSARSRTAR